MRLQLLDRRPFSGSDFPFQYRGHGQNLFFFPRAADNLYADWQALGRLARGNDGGGIAQQIEPFAVTPGIEVFDGFAFDRPTALTVAEGGNGGRGT